MSVVNRVMIIDDDEINNFICVKNLKDSGFSDEASFCLRGKDGLEELKNASPEEIPDVIFLDINMPLMNAWEFLEEYNKLASGFNKEVKLFILSSSVYKRDIAKSSEYANVTDYIIKPLNKATLDKVRETHFA
ncbi:MAG: response regulator [Bacteroidia bacterium]|nr:response regulator [Bacteroidia bacterium]